MRLAKALILKSESLKLRYHEFCVKCEIDLCELEAVHTILFDNELIKVCDKHFEEIRNY